MTIYINIVCAAYYYVWQPGKTCHQDQGYYAQYYSLTFLLKHNLFYFIKCILSKQSEFYFSIFFFLTLPVCLQRSYQVKSEVNKHSSKHSQSI